MPESNSAGGKIDELDGCSPKRGSDSDEGGSLFTLCLRLKLLNRDSSTSVALLERWKGPA